MISSSLLFHSLTSSSSINFLLNTKQASSEVGGRAFSKNLFSRIYSMSSISAILAGSPLLNCKFAILKTSGTFSLSIMYSGVYGLVWASESLNIVWTSAVFVLGSSICALADSILSSYICITLKYSIHWNLYIDLHFWRYCFDHWNHWSLEIFVSILNPFLDINQYS